MRYAGSNGAISKSYRPSVSERIARKTARTVIDLTQESDEEEEARRESETESDKELEEQPESEDSEESEGSEQSEEGEDSNGSEASHESEEHEDSDAEYERLQRLLATQVIRGVLYSVTCHHHRPWGAGDDFRMVGIFNTEEEARKAAFDNYMEICMDEGWEYDWWGDPGDKRIILLAHAEDGEPQQETYRGVIDRIRHEEKPAEIFPVYVVQEERRKVETGFYNELDSLIAAKVHCIYRDVVAANRAAQEICETYILSPEHPKTIKREIRHGLMSIILETRDEQMSYSITVEKRHLL